MTTMTLHRITASYERDGQLLVTGRTVSCGCTLQEHREKIRKPGEKTIVSVYVGAALRKRIEEIAQQQSTTLYALVRELVIREYGGEDERRADGRVVPLCSRCGQPGHNARTCGPATSKRSARCSRCGQPGHNARTCGREATQ